MYSIDYEQSPFSPLIVWRARKRERGETFTARPITRPTRARSPHDQWRAKGDCSQPTYSKEYDEQLCIYRSKLAN